MSARSPFAPLTTLMHQLAAGETTSLALVEGCLARIDALDGKLHAFVDVYRDEALACARAADLTRSARLPLGPLHGLPIALKDLLHIEGRVTTAGSKSWSGRVSGETATAVERLLAAGMIVLGKTHLVEFAFGGWGRNEPMGAPWNPWDMARHRVAGGSSSGSAVAVAAGLAPAALGSDTGGSIRIPASLCGLTGHKPTYGLVSLHGAVPLSPTLDSIGPIARSVDDAIFLLGALAGPDADDPTTLGVPRFEAATALGAQPSSPLDCDGPASTRWRPISFLPISKDRSHRRAMRPSRRCGSSARPWRSAARRSTSTRSRARTARSSRPRPTRSTAPISRIRRCRSTRGCARA